ncbi:hypothetical protein NW768_007502 [Fusarium equiseti]|uniref:Uncharacterized protein n=1 Tax=Fusarium equiseti TaxID=61235 RepID=A0ABQ8R7N0_FUSEQ|nr:hypothetical protein NW768_007502 [Fusarium equiseti]
MAYYFVVKQCLASLRFGADILYTLTKQMDKDRQNDEWFARRLFYSQPASVPNSGGKQATTAMSPSPTQEELRQWRMEWLESQALRAKSRQNLEALRHVLNRLADGFGKHVEGDIDPRHIDPIQIEEEAYDDYEESYADDKERYDYDEQYNDCEEQCDDEGEPYVYEEGQYDEEEELYDDEEESSDDETIDYCPVRSFQLRQLLRFLLALRSTSTAYYNFVIAIIQEYDIDVMIVFALSRLHDPIEGEQQWPPGWKRSPELCCWITQEVVKWMDEIPKEFKAAVAEMGIRISEREDNEIRILADDAASHIMIDSGDRLDRFIGPRF